jgi:hypothetical protein
MGTLTLHDLVENRGPVGVECDRCMRPESEFAGSLADRSGFEPEIAVGGCFRLSPERQGRPVTRRWR